jgi:hypothetical protein
MNPPISVEVSFQARDSDPLTIPQEHSTITLQNPDDCVVWNLVAAPGVTLPANSFLMIRFEDPFGPFQAFRGLGPLRVMSQSNKGDASPTSYTYFLYMLDPQEPGILFKSTPFTIVNEIPAANRSPWLRITFNESNLSEPPQIDPLQLLLHEGDTPLVEIEGVPEDHLVGFWFPTDPAVLGPFKTYFVTRENGAGILRLSGARFDSNHVGEIHYGVRVWNADGVLVASHDPSIDGLGRPPE